MDTATSPDKLPDARLVDALMACRSVPDVFRLAVLLDDAQLDRLEQAAAALARSATGDDAEAITARLADLHRLRTENAEAVRQAREVQAQRAALPAAERLRLAFQSAERPADMMRLVAQTADKELDALEAAVAAQLSTLEGDDAHAAVQRLDDLRTWRAAEQAARAALAPHGEDAPQALADRLVAWIQQPDWNASQTFLAESSDELLAYEGEITFANRLHLEAAWQALQRLATGGQ